jgi:hypothetical protein
MSQISRRFRLIIDHAAAADLIRVRETDQWAHAQIFALLEAYQSGTFPPEELIDERFASDEIADVSPFWHLQNHRLNVYRVKLVSVGAWRILTAGDRSANEVAILAVMHRSQNYQADTALMARIEEAYERLGFKYLGR